MGYGKFLGLLKLRRAFIPKLARFELLFLKFIQFTTAKPSLKSENPEMGDICINLMLAIDLLENPTGWCCDSCQWTSDCELVGILSTIQICSTTMDKNQVQVFMAIQRYFRWLPCHAMQLCQCDSETIITQNYKQVSVISCAQAKAAKWIYFCTWVKVRFCSGT
jgi:hypothetical protein